MRSGDIKVVLERDSAQAWESLVGAETAAGLTAREVQRQNAILELISTEEQYRDKLQMVMDVYLKPLKVQKILTGPQITAVFANWPTLLKKSKDLYKAFKLRQEETNMCVTTLADILESSGPKIQSLYAKVKSHVI